MQASNMVVTSQTSPSPSDQTTASSTPTALPSLPTKGLQHPQQHLSMNDLCIIAADIKDMLLAAISDLHHDIQEL